MKGLKIMKKVVFFLFGLVIFAGLYSRDVNVAAGLTFPRISNQDGTFGFNISASENLQYRDAIILEPGVRIKHLRQFDKTDWGLSSYETTLNMYYLDLFCRAKFDLMENVNSQIKYLPFVGMGVGLFMSGKTKEKTKFDGNTSNDSENLKGTNTFVLSLILGMELPINEKYTFIVEYNRALNSLLEDVTVRSSTLMLNVSYLLKI